MFSISTDLKELFIFFCYVKWNLEKNIFFSKKMEVEKNTLGKIRELSDHVLHDPRSDQDNLEKCDPRI